MYMDRNLEFERIGKDAAAATSRVLAMGQSDLVPLPGATDTADLSPISGLYFIAMAGASDIAAGATITLEHCDTENGTFETLATYGPTTDVTGPGEKIVCAPVPYGLKAFARVTKGDATAMNLFMTYDVGPKTLPTFPK